MKTELESRYYNFPEKEIRKLLPEAEYKKLTRRVVYQIPGSVRSFLRVREIGDEVEVTLKQIHDPVAIDGTREMNIRNWEMDYDKWIYFFNTLGLKQASIQYTEREKFRIYNVYITIDKWPGLKPIIELETNYDAVNIRAVEKMLKLTDYRFAGTIPDIYQQEYGITREEFNAIPELTFNNYLDVLRKR